MNIGVNCFLLQANMGGLKQYFLTLFDELLAQDRENQYTFFYFKHNVAELEHLQNQAWRERAVLLGEQGEIAKYLDGLDLYFCPFGGLWPRPVPIPSVVTLVDIQEVFYPDFFSPIDHFNREYHYRGSTRCADRVITISEFSRRSIIQHHGIAARKIAVAHLSADERYYRACEVAEGVALPAADFILYPANRWKHKNHDVLLRALRRLKQERGRVVHAVFTGYDLPDGYPLLEKAAAYGIADQVCSLGYVSVEQMAYLYGNARMLVFPSLFEGFGIPVVEAMAAGCPVAASNATSVPEILGDAGEYFDPTSEQSVAEAVEKIWSDAALRSRLIAKGRQRATAFSAARTAEAHLAVFGEAVRDFRFWRYAWEQVFRERLHSLKVHARYRAVLQAHARAGAAEANGLSFSFSHGWHAREASGADWWRWMQGKGRITIQVDAAQNVVVRGQAASLQYPNHIDLLLDGRGISAWDLNGGQFEFVPFGPITLSLPRGEHRLEFLSRNAAVRTANDRRRLAVAVKNLAITPVKRAGCGGTSDEPAGPADRECHSDRAL